MGFRVLAVVALVVATWIVGGCEALPMAPVVAPGTRACVGLPAAQCADAFRQADETASQRGTVVLGIAIRCKDVCTAANGEAEISVSFGDGTSDRSGVAWQAAAPAPVGGAPGPEPTLSVVPTCVGVDPATCESRAVDSIRTVEAGHGAVVSIVVRCTPGPCIPTKGDGQTTVTLADGHVRTIDWSYQGGP